MTYQYRPFQCGSALILVLWISLLLSLILVGIITVSRSELRTTRAQQEAFLTHNAAITALEAAAFQITDRRDQSANFTSMTIQVNDYSVKVEKSDEAKKLDINLASEVELTRFFIFLGEEIEVAQKIAANIIDWRDADDIARPNGAERRDYVRARDGRRPANRAFQSISELKEVLGVTSEMVECAMSGLTIFGEQTGPDAQFLTALYQKPYPREETRQRGASLGTSARASNAGGRYSLAAKVSPLEGAESIIISILGVFRVSGDPQRPYHWIAKMPSVTAFGEPNC